MLIGIDASRAVTARRTGTETYSLRLIQALIGLRSGHCFRLYTNGEPPAGLFWDGMAPPNVEVRSIPFPRLWTHLRLSAEMLTRPPDVLFVPAHVLPLIHPRRSVATVHDLGYLYYPDAHRPADRRYLDWSTGWNARRSTLVLADSLATRNATWCGPIASIRARARVVYLGVGDEAASPPALGEAERRDHLASLLDGGPGLLISCMWARSSRARTWSASWPPLPTDRRARSGRRSGPGRVAARARRAPRLALR